MNIGEVSDYLKITNVFADDEAGGVYGSGWAFALFSFGGLFMYGVFRPEFIGS